MALIEIDINEHGLGSVTVDGVELSHVVTQVEIWAAASEPPVVTMTLQAKVLATVDAEVRMVVQEHLEVEDEDDWDQEDEWT